MGWGCYRHEVDMGSEAAQEKLSALCDQKLNEKPRTWGRDGAICPFCWEELEAEVIRLREVAEKARGVKSRYVGVIHEDWCTMHGHDMEKGPCPQGDLIAAIAKLDEGEVGK